MPAPATADEFLDLVRKSGVVDEARLKDYLASLKSPPTDPAKLAGLMVRDAILTHFQAEQILQGKWKRFFIGKYKVLEKLGTGGMGQVFLCEHKLMRRRVAIKVLPTRQAQESSSVDRFYREAKAVAAMDHPNIVRAYDVDQDEHLHFLVMEYVDGTNLHDLVRRSGPLDIVRACHYVYGAAVGLEHAHEMGLVHRDIKPGNILVDRSGVVKLLDMGLARFFHDEEDHLTRKYDENILGTADYLAPEQAIDSHKVDIRADVYSLGATFYFLLAGRPPFPEGTVAQKLLWHQTREPEPLRSLRPEVPPELAGVVERMMAKDPDRRYQSPAEVMAALAVWVQTPIPPPDPRELPQLSPAAVGAGVGSSARAPAGGPPTPPPRPPVSRPGSGEYPQPRSDPAWREPATRVAPATSPASGIAAPPLPPAAAAPATAAPPGESADALWGALASETKTDGSKRDTKRTGRSSRRGVRAEPAKAARRPWVLLAVAGGVGLLVLLGAGGTAAYLIFGRKTQPTGQPSGEPKTWYVTKGASPDKERTLQSLAGALERAGAGDTVQILDERIDDLGPITVSGRAVKKGVRVEAGTPSKTVTWTPRPGSGTKHVIEIADIENFQLTGLVIEAGGSIETGVVVGRGCPGLVVENVTVHAPRVAGFRFQNAVGEPARPIRLKGCKVAMPPAAPPAAKAEAAVQFQGGNRFVELADGRLEGPGQAGVKVDGPAADIEVRSTWVVGFDVGVLFGKAPEGFALTRDYFARTPQIAAGPAGPGFKAAGNTHDAASKEGSLPTGATEGPPPP